MSVAYVREKIREDVLAAIKAGIGDEAGLAHVVEQSLRRHATVDELCEMYVENFLREQIENN